MAWVRVRVRIYVSSVVHLPRLEFSLSKLDSSRKIAIALKLCF